MIYIILKKACLAPERIPIFPPPPLENDFMVSLKSRSEEMIPGGHMVLTVIGSDRKANFSGNQRYATRNILMTLS